jgi:pantetheine-phosphate adenylyltransferase
MIRAVFPGTFDPIHYGHIDIAERAARIFDELIVAVYDRPLKNLLFSPKDRIEMVQLCLMNNPKIKVVGYSGLTVNFCHQVNAQVIVRGLRVFSDFETEFRMALANHRLSPEIEVVALITAEDHSFLSSSTVREIAALGGDISSMVPAHIVTALKNKYAELENTKDVQITSLRD